MKNSSFNFLLIAIVPLMITSCVSNVSSKARTRVSSSAVAGSSKVNIYQGRILADNPIILSKNYNLSEFYDLNKLLSTATITQNNFLQGPDSCSGLDYCFEVREVKESPSSLQTTNGKWGFNANSVEFLQVNTFYHLRAVSDLFFTNLTTSFNRAYTNSVANYETSLPSNLLIKQLMNQPLIAYANCDVADNAYFERTTQTLCLGYISDLPNVKWAQDSTAIYHETGHFFQKLQLNIRNNSITGPNVDMGNLSYDEAGSIGEGISDYYSYYVNGRTHFAEWAAGRFLSASRPISETDTMHVDGISTDSDQRLSYPQFLTYNPNESTIPTEDIHYAGMIISHYLVALTDDLKDKCLMTRKSASEIVIHLLSETLAEHGDLTSNGTQSILTENKINLRSAKSFDWFRIVNPINYRAFTQTFAKNLKNNLALSDLSSCYSKNYIESLLDQYGLLLFRTYNENRNLAGTNTAVTATNRKKSVLISKNLLILDPTVNASTAYVIDNRDQIKDAVGSLQSSGILIDSLSNQTPSDFSFNNDNGKMSPGEVVAVALNLYNNSNAPMGGIQILANDWNHADVSGNPYQFSSSMSNDQWPLTAEGGVVFASTIGTTLTTDFAPVCFIQSNESSSTKWISQSAFRAKMALATSFCLNKDKPNECFIRAVKGADQAHYSKINPKSTWGQTMADPKTGKAPSLANGNVILFEVSKHIPPGTIVDCRLRVRFTNCEDCYHDSGNSNYDYKDYEYNGPKPFRVIHLQIPITD